MKEECENTSVECICLKVFCALTASVTHELKNTLSIINENVGLLEDLGSMAEEGAGVPRQYIDDTAKTVAKQVARSNSILKNLNTFSHSGDRTPGDVDLQDALLLMVALTSRFAAMHKISVVVSRTDNFKVRTNLLVLYSLLFTTLRKVCSGDHQEKVLKIHAGADENKRVVITLAFEGETVSENCPYPELEEQALAAEIGALCGRKEGVLFIDVSACCP